VVVTSWLSSDSPLQLGDEEQGGNGDRGKEYGVGLAFTCVRALMTWRCWQGMNAMRWLGSEPFGRDRV
jgi:hypothetical protein